MWYAERFLLADGASVEIALARSPGHLAYRLRYGRPGAWRVSYGNEGGKGHRRSAGGRASRYEFRSVEQLRYDFERDVAQARHQG
ncbi:MAG: hypothetical protein ACREUO_01455 [Burkholderiales bacterium]